jgi:hypothetical protein
MKKYLVVHCADTYDYMDIGAREIREWHRARGWLDIGYAFVVRRSGTLELGRDLDGDGDVIEETGAHVRGYNRESIGICLVGGKGPDNKPAVNYTRDQIKTLYSILATLKAVRPELEVRGHRDFPGVTKTCPNFNVSRWFYEIAENNV